MSPPGIPTPEKALEDLKEQRRTLHTLESRRTAAHREYLSLDEACIKQEVAVRRAESTLSLAVRESVANESAKPLP